MNSIIHYLFAWYLSVFLVNSQQIDTSFCDINLIPANPANLTPPDVIFTDRYKAVVDKIENNAKFGENIIELLDLNENIGVAKTSTPFLTARSFCYYSTNEILSIIDDECKVSKLNETYQFLTPFFLTTINGEEHIVSPLSLLFKLAGSFQFVYIGDSEFVRGIPVREWQTCIFTRDAAERITYSFSDPTKWSPASLNPFDSKYKSVPVQVLINRKDENGTISEIVYSITQFKPYFDFDESEYYTPPGVYCPGRIQGPHIPELPKAFQVSRELVLPPTPDIPDSKGTVISFRESYDYEYILFKFTFVNGSELTTRIHDFLTGLQYEFNDETSECRVTKLSKNIQDDNIYFDFNKVDYQYTGKRIVDGVNTDVWIGPKTINGENVYFEWHFLADGWIRTDQAGDNDQVTPILLVVHFIPSTPTAPKRLSSFHHFYNYHSISEILLNHDLTRCDNSMERKRFAFTISKENSDTIKKYSSLFDVAATKKLKKLAQVTVLRINQLEVAIDKDSVYVLFTITQKPSFYGLNIADVITDVSLDDAVENLKNSFKNQFEISFRIDEYNREMAVYVDSNSLYEIDPDQEGYIIINKKIYDQGFKSGDVAAVTIIVALCSLMTSVLVMMLHRFKKIKLPFLEQ